MKMPEDAFISKLNQHNFSNEEILKLDKAVRCLREDLRSIQLPIKKPHFQKSKLMMFVMRLNISGCI
ncbi:MAG TPA: hypothetical protein VE467_04370, partial [Chryseolinea sp.]|nr:hypothetical protein [Chryseolinea sp.]